MTPYLDHPLPLVFAHRGFAVGDNFGLENSMVAFHAAASLGITHVETDTQATADGVCLAFHDDTLDRVTDRTGVVHTLPHCEVAKARIGGSEPIPTLGHLLESLPEVNVNIDVKHPRAAEPTARVINQMHAHDRVCIGSFDDAVLTATLQRLDAPVTVAAPTGVVRRFVAMCTLGSQMLVNRVLHDVDCLQVPQIHDTTPIVTERTVAMAHAAGVQVHVWTVNEPGTMRQLLDMGVDGVVTDRSDLALSVRREWLTAQ